MPQYSVEFHPEAVAEARAGVEWYHVRNDAIAAPFVAELAHAIEQIQDAPERWPQYLLGTRRYLLRRFPFSVVYRRQGSRIQIIAVAHGRRRPGYWRTR